MPEEAPPVVEDTPTPDLPASPETGTPAEPAIDWQKRYEDLRPQYDRATQERSQYSQLIDALNSEDSDTRHEAAQALGMEFVDEEPEPVDPTEAFTARLTQLEQQLAEREVQAQQEAVLAEVEARLDQIEGLDEADKDWVVARAIALDPTPEGLPDLQAAYQELQARDERQMKTWTKTKKSPHVSAVGTSATKQPNLDNEEERIAYMAQALADRNQA